MRGEERGDSPQTLHIVDFGGNSAAISDVSSALTSAVASVVSSAVTSVEISACVANTTAADLAFPSPPLPLPSSPAPVWSPAARCVGLVSFFWACAGACSAGGGSLGGGSGGSEASVPLPGVCWRGVETAWEERGRTPNVTECGTTRSVLRVTTNMFRGQYDHYDIYDP